MICKKSSVNFKILRFYITEAVKVLYNRSRIVNILKKFKENVDSKMYSSLPELIQVDLSLLKKPEEKNLLDNYVAKFFPMIESFAINQVDKIPAKLWNFLLLLSQNYSLYYGRCRSLCVSFYFFQLLQIAASSVFIFSGYWESMFFNNV